MNKNGLRGIFTVFTTFLILVFGVSGIFAQGKGHGGGKHGGDKRDKQAERSHGKDNKDERKQARDQRQPSSWVDARQRQERQPRYDRSQDARDVKEYKQGKKREDHRNDVRTERRQDGRDRSYDRGRYQQQTEQRYERYDRRNDHAKDRKQNRKRDNIDYQRRQPAINWNYGWPTNYGQYRSAQVHERNQRRKAWKNEEKALKRYRKELRKDRRSYAYDPYYRDNRYQGNQYEYQNPVTRRTSFVRTLIVNVLGLDRGYREDYYPQDQGYNGPAYNPRYDSGSYYQANPQYPVGRNVAYDNGYTDLGGYYAPQYANDPYYADNYDNGFSIGDLANSSSIGNFVQQIFGQLLAVGYNKGYVAGQNARQAGYKDDYYPDPYLYEDASYSPYSTSIDDNRRCLSEGYELGYNDALNNQGENDPYQNGNVDLVSVLLGQALQVL